MVTQLRDMMSHRFKIRKTRCTLCRF